MLLLLTPCKRIISVTRADITGMEYQMVHPVYIDETSKVLLSLSISDLPCLMMF